MPSLTIRDVSVHPLPVWFYCSRYHIACQNRTFIQGILGLRQDTVFLLHLDNHLDGIIWFWSVVLAGYTPALSPPLVNNPDQHRKHLAHLKKLIHSPVVLTTSKYISSFTDLNIYVLPSSPIEPSAEHVTAPGPGLDSPASPAVLMLTSGSTGNAKAVSLSHSQILSAIAEKVLCHQTTPHDVHVHATDLVSWPLAFLDIIAQHHVSFSFAPNFFLASLAKELRSRTRNGENPLILDLSSLRCITSGGESLVVQTALSLLEYLTAYGCPRSVLVPGFGMTETCARSIHNNKFPDYDVDNGLSFAALGTCHQGIEMRVVQVDETGRSTTAPVGEPGQLHLRGPLVFSEYYNDSFNTRKAFVDDGWFVTGDLAVMDEKGMLRLAGREVKYNISELQSALDMANIPGAVPSYSVGFGHRPEGHGTEVVSVVYLPLYDPDNGKARAETNDAIATVMLLQCSARPHKIIPLGKDELEKTSLGKLSASKLRLMFESGRFDAQGEENKTLLAAYYAHAASSTRSDETTPAERAIEQALSEVLNIPIADTTPNSSMLHMGVNSMQLIRFKKRVQDLLSVDDIPMVTILTNTTVRSLASALQPYCEILVYLNLAKHFSSTRPIYALRARGFDSPTQPFFETIKECISTYVQSILAIQPRGPYNILGYSFGSMFAFEIAKALQSQQGQRISFLGVLNLPPHIKQRIRQLNMVTAILTLSLFLGLIEDDDPATFFPAPPPGTTTSSNPAKVVEEMDPASILDEILLNRAPKGRMDELALTRDKIMRWAEVSNALHAMAVDYEPTGMVEHVDVFVCRPLRQVARNKNEWFAEQVSKWVYFSRTLPRFWDAEGEHFSMLAEENVESFAEILNKALQGRGA
ncbi:acetyl-CoA synthetase-like protein [Rhypophila decipiens]|uniref:Acetyl-CoA synthetase-like protein n=1 Tax=Rhypophila decipiens TaxID=261697 RepID=A0AAN6Y404_9PEZI|nr:acetyl-CoA synthetase-like protein [Rhypophila decipiens]